MDPEYNRIYLTSDPYDILMRRVVLSDGIKPALEEVSTMDDTRCHPVVREAAAAVLEEIKLAEQNMRVESWVVFVFLILGGLATLTTFMARKA